MTSSTQSDIVVGAAVADSGPPAATGATTGGRPSERFAPGSARRKILVHGIQLGIVVVVLAVWQHVGTGKTQRYTISTPQKAFEFIRSWAVGDQGHGLHDLSTTIYEASYGWVLGVVSGLVLAVVVSTSRWIQLFIAPFVSLLNALPKIALAPLFILLYGQSLRSKVYFVAAGIFFITFYNVYNGVRSIDPVYLRNARVLGANLWHLVREVYGPAIVGWVMSSLRLTAAWSLTSAVVAEYLGARKGIGRLVSDGQMMSAPDIVIGGILVVACTALLVDRIIVRVERRFSRWRLV